MKKLVLFSVAAAALLFASCSNKSNEGTTNDADTTKIEVVEEVVTPAEESGDVVEKYISLMEKFVANPTDASAAKVAEEIAALAQSPEYVEAMQKMTPEQMQKLQEIGQKYADALAGK